MNLRIIHGCAGADHGLPTAGTDPGCRYITLVAYFFQTARHDLKDDDQSPYSLATNFPQLMLYREQFGNSNEMLSVHIANIII